MTNTHARTHTLTHTSQSTTHQEHGFLLQPSLLRPTPPPWDLASLTEERRRRNAQHVKNLLHERDEEPLLSSFPCLAVPPDPSSFASVPPSLPLPPSVCFGRIQKGPLVFVGFFFPSSFASLIVFTSQPVETYLPSPGMEGEEEEGRLTGYRRTHKPPCRS